MVHTGFSGPNWSQNWEIYVLLLSDQSILSFDKSVDILKVSTVDVFFEVISMERLDFSGLPQGF